MKNGSRDGYGVLKLDKIVYRGTWKNDRLVGKAEKEIGKNKYIGYFDEKCQLSGEGEYAGDDGSIYNGNFRNNLFDGQGVYISPDGDKYVGQFSKGEFSGQGVYFWKNGQKYVGYFRHSQLHGAGTMYYKDGGQDIGYWEYNKLKTIKKSVRIAERK